MYPVAAVIWWTVMTHCFYHSQSDVVSCISEKIPVDDEHWQNLLNLLVILDSVFASVTSLDSAAFLLPTMSSFAGYILQDLSR